MAAAFMHTLTVYAMISLCTRTIAICLFFIAAGIPLLINPFAFNWVELIKRESAYALICLLIISAVALTCKKKTLCACTRCP